MPLLVMCGGPSSGKTTVANRIAENFNSRGFDSVDIISDDCNGNFLRSIYNDSRKEREQRGFLRSDVQRRLSKERLIICDSLNYIKGFRYELFCVCKLVQTTFAVMFCDADAQSSKWLDSQKDDHLRYGDDKIDEILMRFEPPNGKNRWDSPLFTISVGGQPENDTCLPDNQPSSSPLSVQLPFDDIFTSLVQGKALSANMSTQSAPLAASNFLRDLDKITKEIVTSVFQQQKDASCGDSFTVPHCECIDDQVKWTRQRTLPDLTRLRRQFISYTKMHPVDDKSRIASLFVDYLNSNE